MNKRSVRVGLVSGLLAMAVPVGVAGAGRDVSAQGKAEPVVQGSCTRPSDGTPSISGAGRYDSLRTGAIRQITVRVENTTRGTWQLVGVETTYAERTSGNFVFTALPEALEYEPGDAVQAYITVSGRRAKTLAAYGYFACA